MNAVGEVDMVIDCTPIVLYVLSLGRLLGGLG